MLNRGTNDSTSYMNVEYWSYSDELSQYPARHNDSLRIEFASRQYGIAVVAVLFVTSQFFYWLTSVWRFDRRPRDETGASEEH
jgi:hypothetical protein